MQLLRNFLSSSDSFQEPVEGFRNFSAYLFTILNQRSLCSKCMELNLFRLFVYFQNFPKDASAMVRPQRKDPNSSFTARKTSQEPAATVINTMARSKEGKDLFYRLCSILKGNHDRNSGRDLEECYLLAGHRNVHKRQLLG